jgi:hypothetical protein
MNITNTTKNNILKIDIITAIKNNDIELIKLL